MKHRTFLFFLVGITILLGTTFAVISTDSREAKATATYVGQETCMSAGCHATDEGGTYSGAEEFMKTMHHNIHKRPTPENVVIDRWFREERTLTTGLGKDGKYPFYIDLRKGETPNDYQIQLRSDGPYADSTGWMKVAYNYGGNGWLQRFLVEVDGSYYPIPFQYVLPHYRETHTDTGTVAFNNINTWLTVDNDLDALVFFKKDSQEFFNGSWDAKCAACHVNGFDVMSKETPSSGANQWIASWVGRENSDSASKDINIAIGCESCHGPGSEHAADPENRDYLQDIDPGRWDRYDTSRYWTDRKLDLCNQCHNRHSSTDLMHRYAYDDENNLPYLPGLELKDFVNDLVLDAEYWDAVAISKAHHQTGQDYWRSAHYAEHVFTNGCFDCHTPHSNTPYPYQLDRNWYSLTQGEGCLATGCHITYGGTEIRDGKEYNLHTKHTQGNSQCVNCHYTKIATISFTGKFEFTDHSDKVIRPSATIYGRNSTISGVPNTCAFSCHRNGYGERNRPDAFDEHVAVKFSTGGVPGRAPDYGIVDRQIDNWKESSDIALADSLWLAYQVMYSTIGVRTGDAKAGAAAIASISPNPARDVVRVRFNLPRIEHVRLEVYNTQGQMVRLLSEGRHEAGQYEDEWEGIDELNRNVASGAYFVRLSGQTFTTSASVLLLR